MTTALREVSESGPLLLERARDLAIKATTVDEAKEIRDQVKAMSVYMRSRGASEETVKYANKARLWVERRIGQLIRDLPKAPGRRTDQLRDRLSPGCMSADLAAAVQTKREALEGQGIAKKQAQRWEKLAEPNETEFAAIVEKKVDTASMAAKRAEEKGAVHVSHNSGEVEWYTPPEYIEAARRVMRGIDLDPASCLKANETVQAKRYYSKDNSGLDKDWSGRVWMNPPYAKGEVDAFASKLAAEVRTKHVSEACVLVNNATETEWFRTLADVASAVCFPSSRVKFLDRNGRPVGAPLQGQAVIYAGPNTARFVSEFSAFGDCWIKP